MQMRRSLRYAIGAITVALVLANPSLPVASASDSPQGFETTTLRLVTQDQSEHWFTVYLATSRWQRARGLSFVEHLPPDQGMLFLFPPRQRIIMWMKDTFIPLDMLFMAPDGRVLQIVENAVPGSLERIYADPGASVVLELNGGTVQRLGIRPGARALFPRLDVQH